MDGDLAWQPKRKPESHTNNAIKNLIEHKKDEESGTRNKGAPNKAKSSARTKRKRSKPTNGSHDIKLSEECDIPHADVNEKSCVADERAQSPSPMSLTRSSLKSRKSNVTGFAEPEKKRPKAVPTRTSNKIKGHTLLEWLQEAAGSTVQCAVKEGRSTSLRGEGEVNDRTSKRRRRDGTLTSNSTKPGSDGRVRPHRKAHNSIDTSLAENPRYAVNAFEVVPEGLMDLMDDSSTRNVMHEIVRNHVENWITKTNFDNHFITNLESSLYRYYPINYTTLLDHVIVIFLFKRPNFMDSVLNLLIEKFSIQDPLINWLKIPLMERFTMTCKPVHSSTKDAYRHDFACLNLLRCLIERNIDTYAFHSWISACFSNCSDNVQQSFVKRFYDHQLWSCHSQVSELDAKTHKQWKIDAPLHQLCGIIQTENVRGDSSDNRLLRSFSSACARYMLMHMDVSDMNNESFLPAFRVFFNVMHTHGQSMCAVRDWLKLAVAISFKEDENRLLLSIRFITKCIFENGSANGVVTILEKLLLPIVLSSSDMEALLPPIVSLIVNKYIPVVLKNDEDIDADSIFLRYRSARNKNDTLSLTASKVAMRLSRLLCTISGYDNSQCFLRLWMKTWRDDQTSWIFYRALIEAVVFESNRKTSEWNRSVLDVLRHSTMEFPFLIAHKLQLKGKEPNHSDLRKVAELLEFLLLTNGTLACTVYGNIIQTFLSREILNDQFAWSVIVRPMMEMLTFDSASIFNFIDEAVYRNDTERRELEASITVKALGCIFSLVQVDAPVKNFLRKQFSQPIFINIFVKLLESKCVEIVVWSLQLLPHMLHMDDIVTWSDPSLLNAVLLLTSSPHHHVSEKAIALIEQYTRISTSHSTLCWHLLKYGTDQCCGCRKDPNANAIWSQKTISILAELTCFCLSEMHSQYIKRHFLSCESQKTTVNVFVLITIQRLIPFDLGWKWPSMAQYALEKISIDAPESIQSIYLDILLKAFKIGVKHLHKNNIAGTMEIQRIVFNEHVVSYLHEITRTNAHSLLPLAHHLILQANEPHGIEPPTRSLP